MLITIASDFSKMPGARYESEGPNSGARFRNEILLPKYKEAEAKDEVLEINLDGCYGFATSFLEESFGGLVRILKRRGLLKRIKIVCNDDVTLEALINQYVKEAEAKL